MIRTGLFALTLLTSACLLGCGKDEQEQTVRTFANADACAVDISNEATEEEKQKHKSDCETAFAQARVEHERSAPHYSTLDECIGRYGENMCVAGGSGSYYMPQMSGFMAGFVAGHIAGALISQPIYHDRWGYAYSGGSSLGYYRGGYVASYHNNTTWTKNYYVQTVPHGTTPNPPSPARGGFGASASTAKSGASISGGKAPVSAPVGISAGSVARGGFGGAAASASSSASSRSYHQRPYR